MITDDRSIRQLSLRSDLPRLMKEGFHLFAALEGDEQKDAAKLRLVAQALAAFVASEEARSERPLPAIVPRAFVVTSSDPDWENVTLQFDLESPYERRRRDGTVLGIARHLEARVRLFKGAFAYVQGDDLRAVDALSPAAATAF